MSPLARLNHLPGLHFFRPALAVSLVTVLLTVAMARPSEAGGAAGTLSISDMSMCEGNSGSTTFSVTAKLTGTTGPFTFLWVTGGGGTSSSTSDYTPTSFTGDMSGADGETATFDIQVNGDTDVEPDETFFVFISDVAGGGELPTLGVNMATATILDDDGSACGGGGDIPTLSIDDVRSLEGHIGTKNFSFTATLSGATDAFTVKAATEAGGSATAGTDYTAASKTLSFAGTTGETKTFDVSVVGDADIEGDETFFVRLSDVQGSGVKPIIFFDRGQGTIANDDSGLQNLTITSPASKSASFDAESWGGRTEFGCGTGDECLIRDSGRILVAGNLTSWEAATTATWMKVTRVDRTPGGGEIFYSVDPVGTNAEILANDPIFGDRTGSITIGPETLLVSQQGLGRAATQFACEMRHFITRLLGPGSVEQMVMMSLRGGAFSIPIVSRRLGAPTVQATISDDCAAVGRLRALEGANAFLAAIAAPRTARSAGGKDLARGFRDFNGDGLEEIGVFAPELGGAGRGAWLQLYNRKGKKVLSFFADKKLLLLQTVAMDTDGNGKAEAVLLGTEASGASELQLRNSNGGLEDRKSVSPEGSVGTVLMGFELDGARGEEIGIAHTDKKGTGEFAVWERTGKKLRRVAEHTVIPAKSAFHQWLRIDVDSDGREEIAAAYTSSSGKGASLRVMDPRSGKVLVDKKVLSTSFEQAVWMLGDFDTARSGAEFFVGYRRKGSGKASFKVLASDGTTLSTSPVLAKGARAWGTIRSRRNSNGNARDLVFVAFAGSKGGTTFEVWDPSTKKAKRIGAGTLASDEYEVLSLQAADFDGDADNGTEIVAVTRHLSNRDIGFQMFSRSGTSLGERVQVFDNSYISLTVGPIVFANKGRTDLALTARQVGGQPEVHVWNVNAQALIEKISVLSKNVE